MFEDVATNVTERIVAEFIALAPCAKHCRDNVTDLCSTYTSAPLKNFIVNEVISEHIDSTYLTYGPGDDDVVLALRQPKLRTVFHCFSTHSFRSQVRRDT